MAQPAGYKYRKRVLLESDEVFGTTNHINFPLLISITDSDLRSTSNGGGVVSNSGFDIIVTALNGTPLDQQLHSYDPTTGSIIIWARIGSLSPTTDVEGYIYFGNSNIFSDQSTTAVWSSEFVGVWHLDNLKDATGNNADLINTNASTNSAGVVGSAQEFDGDGDNLQDAGGDIYLDDLTAMTLSLWAKADAAGVGSDRGLIHGRDPNGNDNRLQIRYDAAGQSGGGSNVFRVNSRIDNLGSKANLILESSNGKQSSSWRYINATWSSGNAFNFYLDGLPDTPTSANSQTGVTFGNTKLIIGKGAKDGLTSSWDGLIDEVWIENVERSADWIRTVHNNMNNPSAFFFIQNVNDLPVLADIEGVDLNYTTLSGPQNVSQSITVQDFNDVYVDSAGVQIFTNYQSSEDTLLFTTQNGISAVWREGSAILFLSGHALQTDYQTALRSVKYENSSASPTTSTRTLRFALYDAVGISNIVSRDLVFDQPNNAPVLANLEGSTFDYPDSYGDTTLTASITVTDADDAYLDTLEVRFTANFVSGEDILGFTNTGSLAGSWNGVAGVLTITGNSALTDYQSAMRAVTYRNVNPAPTTSTRTIQFRVNDADDWSNAVTRDLTVTPLNNAPELAGIESSAIVYNAGDGAVALTDSIITSDGDDTNLDSARVKITSNYFATEDVLAFANQLGISGTWYSGAGEILLQGSASLADYQTSLRAITYENTAGQPKSPTRVVQFTIFDGDAGSASVSRSVSSGAPGTISGLELWLRADAGAYSDAGSNLCTDGEGVDQWHDQSGYDRDFIDNTARPIWRETVPALNNSSAIEFAGTGDHFRDGDGENYVNDNTEYTIFSVIKSDVTNTDRGWISARNPGNGDRDISLRYDAIGDNSGENNVIKSGILLNSSANQIESVADIQTTDPQIVSLQWKSGFVYEMWVDGVLMNPSSQQSIPVGTITTALRVNIGQGPANAAESWDGHIAEIIFYSKSVSESERLKIEDYLSEKYAISTGLIDPADGGDSLSVDQIGGTFTTLTGPRLTEDVIGEFTNSSTIVLSLPAGFEWDTGGGNPTLTVEPAYGASTALTASYTSRSSSAVTFSIDSPSSTPTKPGSIIFSDLRVRPTTSSVPTTGMITNTGTTGPAGSVNLGDLGTIAGFADSLVFVAAPGAGNATEVLVPAISVQIVDQYGNAKDTSGVSISMSLTTGTGTLSGTSSQNSDVDGVATFNDLSIDLTGTKRLTASATGLSSSESGDFTISPSGEYTTFKIERSSGGDILDQVAGSAFTIKISAVDATETVDTDFSGTIDLTTTSSFLTGGGTSPAFTAGVLSSLTVNLSAAGNHSLTATTTGGSQTGTSNTFTIDPGSADVTTTQITASPTAIANNGISTSTITVTVTDAYNNVLSSGGETVNLVTDAGTLLSTPTDNLNGTYSQSLQSSTTAETATISGLLNAVNIQDSAQVQFNDYSTVWQSSPGAADSTAEWELSSNWSNGVPTNTDDVLIPATPANGTRQPIISVDNQQVNDMTIVSGADVTLSGNISFDVIGDLLGEGELNGGSLDSVIIGGDVSIANIDLGYVALTGTSQQQITQENTFQRLELDNAAGAIRSGDLFVSSELILTEGTLVIPPGSFLIANTQTVSSGNIKLSREITGSTGWRLLGAPLESNYGDFLDSLFTQGYTGSDSASGSPSVLWYDESYVGTDNQRWRKPSNITNATIPGRGHFVYVFGDIAGETAYSKPLPVVLDIIGDEDLGVTSTFDFGVTYTALADTGWNLVANPFAASIDWDGAGWTKTNMDNTIYVWDASLNSGNGGYLTWNGVTGSLGDGLIQPFQAFWVKANASSPQLKVNLSNKTTGGVFYKVTTPPAAIIFHAELDTLEALTHLHFSPMGSTGRDHLDAFQLEAPTETRIDLYTTNKRGEELTINALPNYFGLPLEIPLDIRAWVDGQPQDGIVSLRWPQLQNIPEGWILTLTDLETGTTVDLLNQASYTFELGTGNLAKPVPLPPYSKGVLPAKLTRQTQKSSMRYILSVDPGSAFPELPRSYALGHNYPNPFNPSTTIQFDMPLEGVVQLQIFDVRGRWVETLLADQNLKAGKHELLWSPVGKPSGIYLIRLQIDNRIFSGKMLLLR